MTLHCSNPSCSATLTVGHIYTVQTTMRREGWRNRREGGRLWPLCPRCDWEAT